MAGKTLTGHLATGKQVLPTLPPFARLSERVVTVLGLNPSSHTLTGTNTYLVGTGKSRILIDAGEGAPGYIDNLEKAMHETGCSGLQEAIITHWHHDHTGGIGDILAKWPGLKVSKMIVQEENEAHKAWNYEPIQDGQIFHTEGATLTAIHTPGHTTDHICLKINEEPSVFTGDCVLGIGTAVFETLSDYLESLIKILQLSPTVLYCGHGPHIEEGVEAIQNYISHREKRIQQVFKVLLGADEESVKPMSAAEIVDVIYPDIPEGLKRAAVGNTMHALEKLCRDGKIKQAGTHEWIVAKSQPTPKM
eukprot:m.345613 g.345613  ORF g.345613 m.345613 type:complete len:306 (+) comp26895_c0_seq1:170-1087(+)